MMDFYTMEFTLVCIILFLPQADELLVSGFSPSTVAAYITCQAEPGGDWYNLVVLAEGAVVEDFTQDNLVHSAAVKEVAPQYYSKVRIHRGVLDMHRDKEMDLVFTRTLELHYRNGEVLQRTIKNWK